SACSPTWRAGTVLDPLVAGAAASAACPAARMTVGPECCTIALGEAVNAARRGISVPRWAERPRRKLDNFPGEAMDLETELRKFAASACDEFARCDRVLIPLSEWELDGDAYRRIHGYAADFDLSNVAGYDD